MNNDTTGQQNSALQQLSALFNRYRKALAHTVARIVRPQDIEDIVQETYLRIYQAAQRTQIHHPKSFMLKTARNLALNHVGSADAMNYLAPDEDDGQTGVTESTESIVQSNEEFRVFCRALRELPLQCRRVFVLRKIYGLSQRDVAKHLGISEATVEKHVAKGIVACSAYMKALGYARERSSRFASAIRKSS